jgi:LmbE family N-acetylglucosaminyl deacetylase
MKPLKWIGTFLFLLFIYSGSIAVSESVGTLPEDRGTAGTLSALEKLPIYVRVLQTTAHPDDESAGTLTWLSRKYHATTALFCLTRGEGGQNILGKDKYEALGLVRTGELLEACRFYGIDLFFGNNVDFGFSKTAEETFAKWGHDAALEEMVRFIRAWRPSIILSRFRGDSTDGHGHHQATGSLTIEAFHAAADPAKFPEHFSRGLRPWKTDKLFLSARNMRTVSNATTVRIPVGEYDPVLGRSYREIGSEGYSKHRTQGNGATFSFPGMAYEYFELAESSSAVGSDETGFFDSLDTSLTAICRLADDEEGLVPFLRKDLSDAVQAADTAMRAFQVKHPERSAAAVAEGVRILTGSLRRVKASSLSASLKKQVTEALQEKISDFRKAVNAVLGIRLIALSENETAVPGQDVQVSVQFYNQGSETVDLEQVSISAPGAVTPSDANPPMQKLAPANTATYRFTAEIPEDAAITEPFWYLEDMHDARYKLREADDDFLPFGKPVMSAEVAYRYGSAEITISEIVKAQAGDPIRGPDLQDFQIVPALSVTLEPDSIISPLSSAARTRQFQVSIKNNRADKAEGTLKLVSDRNWPIQPAEIPFSLYRKDEVQTANFTIRIPAGTKSGGYVIAPVATMDGRQFMQQQRKIAYPGNWTRFLYDNAQSKIEVFDIRVPDDLTVGYVPGAGDDVPAALEKLGIPVQIFTSADLVSGDFNSFSAIITGIRAYNVNEDLQSNNRRLLEYVSNGGVLIVQYVRPEGRPAGPSMGSPFQFGPYPMSVSSSDRITVEDSPVKILDPGHRIFNWPNKITEADFEGWVQERGLYFMNAWDERYKPLLSGHDPGEDAKEGGMLLARYGKGYFIYSAYSWFRQLPAGVPGAFRIFANMISLGSEQK